MRYFCKKQKECTDPESNRGRVELAQWQRLSIPLTHQCLLVMDDMEDKLDSVCIRL